MPPISFPWEPLEGRRRIITDEIRTLLEAAQFPGLSYRPVELTKVVSLPWHLWDLNHSEPAEFPEDSDPSNYIDGQMHDEVCGLALGKVWELVPPNEPVRVAQLRNPSGGFLDFFIAYTDRTDFPPIFSNSEKYGHFIIDYSARQLFERYAGEWVKFCEIEFRPLSEDPLTQTR